MRVEGSRVLHSPRRTSPHRNSHHSNSHHLSSLQLDLCLVLLVLSDITKATCTVVKIDEYGIKFTHGYLSKTQLPSPHLTSPHPTPPQLTPTHPNSGTTASSTGYWQVASGSNYCQIVDGGRCVTDGSGNYGSGEKCRVIARRPFFVYTKQYDVERGSGGRAYDYLTVKGIQYENSPPNGVKMKSGAALDWYSDGSQAAAGWKVCAEDKMATPKPTKKGRYIPRPPHAEDTSRLASPHLTPPHHTIPHHTQSTHTHTHTLRHGTCTWSYPNANPKQYP